MNPNCEGDLHLYLTSDDKTCEVFNKRNDGSNFKNILAHPVFFKADMECALISYSYLNEFQNYVNSDDSILIFDFLHSYPPGKPPNKSSITKYGKMYKLNIKSGFYATPLEFESALQKAVEKCQIPRLAGKKIFSYDEITHRFSIENIKNNYLAVLVRGFSINLLGLSTLLENSSQNFVVLGKSKIGNYYFFPDNITGK